MIQTRLKVCCIRNKTEAKIAVRCGADALGFVVPELHGTAVISYDDIKSIIREIPPFISTVLLTKSKCAKEIEDALLFTSANTLQLVDQVDPSLYDILRLKTPSIKIIQVIHITDENSKQHAIDINSKVDAILCDSGKPHAGILGGTGKVHNWEITRIIRDNIKVPLILAGGLNSQNVSEAIEKVQPWGIDLCNGIRKQGMLDEEMLIEFHKTITNAH
jgi:phosphoribosylanthranilate isomerase